MSDKKKINKGKIFTKIIAGAMALFMVLGACFTLIYYIKIML